jgi:hypothetical protein
MARRVDGSKGGQKHVPVVFVRVIRVVDRVLQLRLPSLRHPPLINGPQKGKIKLQDIAARILPISDAMLATAIVVVAVVVVILLVIVVVAVVAGGEEYIDILFGPEKRIR